MTSEDGIKEYKLHSKLWKRIMELLKEFIIMILFWIK